MLDLDVIVSLLLFLSLIILDVEEIIDIALCSYKPYVVLPSNSFTYSLSLINSMTS